MYHSKSGDMISSQLKQSGLLLFETYTINKYNKTTDTLTKIPRNNPDVELMLEEGVNNTTVL